MPGLKLLISGQWFLIPSSVERLLHVWIGAFLAGAFLVISVHAWYLLKNRHIEISKKAVKIALVVATVFSLSQLVTGHASADGVAENQPAKLAAMEGHYDSLAAADMYIFGWVNDDDQKVTGLAIPGGLSFLTHGEFDEPVIGLNNFNKEDRPSQVNAVFQFLPFDGHHWNAFNWYFPIEHIPINT